MKTVILMRHADSYPTGLLGYEQERPISVTGMLQIEQMRAAIQGLLTDLDFVLCSGMKRAKQTFQAIYSVIPARTKFMFDDFLYQISSSSLLDKIQWTPTIYHKILVIGHNPGLSQFLEEVAPGKNLKTMAICEVVVLEADVKIWQDVSYNCLVERKRIRPTEQTTEAPQL